MQNYTFGKVCFLPNNELQCRTAFVNSWTILSSNTEEHSLQNVHHPYPFPISSFLFPRETLDSWRWTVGGTEETFFQNIHYCLCSWKFQPEFSSVSDDNIQPGHWWWLRMNLLRKQFLVWISTTRQNRCSSNFTKAFCTAEQLLKFTPLIRWLPSTNSKYTTNSQQTITVNTHMWHHFNLHRCCFTQTDVACNFFITLTHKQI